MEWRRQNEETESRPPQPLPLVRQNNRSNLCFSRCFRSTESEANRPVVVATLSRSTSMWIRCKSGELPEIKDWCRGLVTRMGKSSRRGFMEFRYDPLSYALNFDEGGDDEASDADGIQYRNFFSRLPSTPMHSASGIDCR